MRKEERLLCITPHSLEEGLGKDVIDMIFLLMSTGEAMPSVP